jgi:hypothetical protein
VGLTIPAERARHQRRPNWRTRYCNAAYHSGQARSQITKFCACKSSFAHRRRVPATILIHQSSQPLRICRLQQKSLTFCGIAAGEADRTITGMPATPGSRFAAAGIPSCPSEASTDRARLGTDVGSNDFYGFQPIAGWNYWSLIASKQFNQSVSRRPIIINHQNNIHHHPLARKRRGKHTCKIITGVLLPYSTVELPITYFRKPTPYCKKT